MKLAPAPYNISRLLQAANRVAWIVCLVAVGAFVYHSAHSYWVGWPWETQHILLTVTSSLVRYQDESWKTYVPGVALILPSILWVAGRRRWSRRLYAPFGLALFLIAQIWVMASVQFQQLQFTPHGLSIPWGFVRWNQVETYRWQRVSDPAKGIVALRLTLTPGYPLVHVMTWNLYYAEEQGVNKLLKQYRPGRGNNPPTAREVPSA